MVQQFKAICRVCMLLVMLFVVSLPMITGFNLHNKKLITSPIFMKLPDISSLSVNHNPIHHFENSISFILSDTSISEEDVLAVTGATVDLPDPIFIIGLAAVVLLGVGILQFSLGDLTKEEGQARVRDYLKTRGDTERKRGYFD